MKALLELILYNLVYISLALLQIFYFPKEGTKGKIVAIYNDYETVGVR